MCYSVVKKNLKCQKKLSNHPASFLGLDLHHPGCPKKIKKNCIKLIVINKILQLDQETPIQILFQILLLATTVESRHKKLLSFFFLHTYKPKKKQVNINIIITEKIDLFFIYILFDFL